MAALRVTRLVQSQTCRGSCMKGLFEMLRYNRLSLESEKSSGREEILLYERFISIRRWLLPIPKEYKHLRLSYASIISVITIILKE